MDRSWGRRVPFRKPFPALRQFESACPCRFPGNAAPPSPTPAPYSPPQARRETIGIASAWPDEWSTRFPAGSDTANSAASVNEADAWCDTHTAARNPPPSSPKIAPPAGDCLRSDIRSLLYCNSSYSRTGTRIAAPAVRVFPSKNRSCWPRYNEASMWCPSSSRPSLFSGD